MSRLLGILKFGQSKYISALHNRPVITKAATSGFLYFVSDSLVQGIEIQRDGSKKYSFGRSINMAIFGFCVTGPLFHYWYKILDKSFPKKTTRHVVIKIVADQIACAPIFDAAFFAGMGILEGKGIMEIKDKIKKDWWETYRADCFVWPVINYVNFKYISSANRVTFMNFGNILWTAFLAKMNFDH